MECSEGRDQLIGWIRSKHFDEFRLDLGWYGWACIRARAVSPIKEGGEGRVEEEEEEEERRRWEDRIRWIRMSHGKCVGVSDKRVTYFRRFPLKGCKSISGVGGPSSRFHIHPIALTFQYLSHIPFFYFTSVGVSFSTPVSSASVTITSWSCLYTPCILILFRFLSDEQDPRTCINIGW